MTPEVSSALDKASSASGIPKAILYAVMMNESGGNPLAHATVGEDSRGLFQVNVPFHPEANSGMLFNPEYNAVFTSTTLLKPAYNAGVAKGLNGASLASYVEQYGERPAWTTTVDNRVRSAYASFTGGKVDTSTPGVTNVSSTNPVSSALSFLGGASLKNVETSLNNGIKFFGVYTLLFLLLIFILYMTFKTDIGGVLA